MHSLILYLFCYLFLLIFVMVSVGFFTLLERSVLGYIQIRKGPNKVGYMGILQPFSDGLKLFASEQFIPMNSNYMIYFLCPSLGLIQSLFMWILFPFYSGGLDFSLGLLFFLCCSSLGVYSLIICGWSSNSVYSMLGCIRSVSQAISYEVSLSMIILGFFLLLDSYNLLSFYMLDSSVWLLFISIPLFLCWISCCLAESNRTPFDFSEGESELVSGFNIEYGGGGFAFLFISEYSSIIFICMLTCMVFMGCNFNSFFFYFKLNLMCFFFVWVRATLPRYRYDKLMYLAWKCYLPVSMYYMFFFIFLKSVSFYHFFL